MSLLFYIIAAIVSLLVMIKSANYAVSAIVRYSKTTGISDYVIGFLVVSVGTTLPELSTAVMGSIGNQGKLVLGDLMGASVVDVTIVLGLVAVIGRNIKVQGRFKHLLPVLCAASLPLLLGLDGEFSSLDGIILLIAFAIYTLHLLKKEISFGYIKKEVKFKHIWKDMFVFVGCLIALLLSARWLLISMLHISVILQIPPYFMGLIFMGLATTLPELFVEIKSVTGGHSSIAFGDLLGSVVANSTLVLGIAAILRPITFDKEAFILSAMFVITAVFIGTLFLNKGKITWKEGIGLLLIYATFVISQGFLI